MDCNGIRSESQTNVSSASSWERGSTHSGCSENAAYDQVENNPNYRVIPYLSSEKI